MRRRRSTSFHIRATAYTYIFIHIVIANSTHDSDDRIDRYMVSESFYGKARGTEEHKICSKRTTLKRLKSRHT